MVFHSRLNIFLTKTKKKETVNYERVRLHAQSLDILLRNRKTNQKIQYAIYCLEKGQLFKKKE